MKEGKDKYITQNHLKWDHILLTKHILFYHATYLHF